MTQAVNLAIISGEMSGDNAGAALARALREQRPDVALWGMGSRRMAEAGVEVLFDSARWSAIGVVEALKVYPELKFRIYPALLREIEQRKPAAVVLIDFGAFNVTLARWCKTHGVRVLYYFPPGSWRKNGRRGAELARITDRIATPFPWSAERLAKLGANVEFVGHPLLELARPSMTKEQFAARFGMDVNRPIIGLLPGSRGFEIEHNTPAMLGAARLIRQQLPETQFVFGLASDTALEQVERAIETERKRLAALQEIGHKVADDAAKVEDEARRSKAARLITPEGVTLSPEALRKRDEWLQKTRVATRSLDLPPVVLAEQMTYDVMAHSDALLICSGTATLEAAILGTPMVILYRGSRLMELEAKVRRVRPEHIGMPNIIAGERILPEFIQHEASPENLSESVLRFVREPDTRAQTKEALRRVREALGEPGASARTARMALELASLTPV